MRLFVCLFRVLAFFGLFELAAFAPWCCSIVLTVLELLVFFMVSNVLEVVWSYLNFLFFFGHKTGYSE